MTSKIRIDSWPVSKYPFWIRYLFKLQEKKFGTRLIPTEIWGQSPWLCFAMTLFFVILERKSSPLSPLLRSIAMVRVAQLNWCTFCVDLIGSFVMMRSGDASKLHFIEHWKDHESQFSQQEVLALRYAEAMTDTASRVSDALYR